MTAFAEAPGPPAREDWERYLATHGRSFSFASRLVPEPHRSRIAGVYAYCRYTDDLVDRWGAQDPAATSALLDRWLERSWCAYQGRTRGSDLLSLVMGDMAGSGVSFDHVRELIEGMRMDVRGQRYETLDELRVYCRRVASVVGLWLTELFGVHDPVTLARAARLGMAMQLTNIVRDVGEDHARGRVYLPAEAMRRHGVTEATIDALRGGDGGVPRGYAALMEELMLVAEADYREAELGIAMLPLFFGDAVAIAARVYAAIHDQIRANGYDTARQRATTSFVQKVSLARATLAARGASVEALQLAMPRAHVSVAVAGVAADGA